MARLPLRKRPATQAERKRAERLAYVAAALMVVSGTTGSTAMLQLGYAILSAWLPFLDMVLVTVLVVGAIVAALGGLAVAAGGFLVGHGKRRRVKLGKLLMTIGVGSGLVGLTIHLLLATIEGRDPAEELVAVGSTVSGLALLLSIYARYLAGPILVKRRPSG